MIFSHKNRTYPPTSWFTLIVLVSIALRIVMAFYLGDVVVELPGIQDQISYDTLAQRVIDGHGFSFGTGWWPATKAGEPTAHWSYLYTLYLAAIYGLVGYHPLVARLIQAILVGFLMPWLVYRLGQRYFNATVGLVAAGLVAVYIYFIFYAAALMTESFYIIAILWALDTAGQLGQSSGSRSRWLWLGLALGVTILLRQVFLLFIPILFLWLLWRSYYYKIRSIPQTIGGLVAVTLILVLFIVPWTFRNYQAFNRFVLLNTNAGFAFFWGNHPIHGYSFISILRDEDPSYLDLIPPELLDLNEAELDQALLKQGLGFIQADPVRYVILSVSRAKDYFRFWPSSESGLISNVSRVLSFGIMWPFMAYGFITMLRRSFSTETLILYLFIITYTGIHLMTWALIRYRLPVDAILLIFAGIGLIELQKRVMRWRYAKFQNSYTSPEFHSSN